MLDERRAQGKPAPASLDELVREGAIQADLLDSPLGDAPGGDFVYVRQGSNPRESVLLYDATALPAGEGTNVAFIDGSVRWVMPDELGALNVPRSK